VHDNILDPSGVLGDLLLVMNHSHDSSEVRFAPPGVLGSDLDQRTSGGGGGVEVVLFAFDFWRLEGEVVAFMGFVWNFGFNCVVGVIWNFWSVYVWICFNVFEWPYKK